MDFEAYSKIKKHNNKYLQGLIETYSKKAWFMCYHLTGKVTKAAPLFIDAFKETVDYVAEAEAPPRSDFKGLLYGNIYRLSIEGIEDDEEFEDLPKPQIDAKYTPFVKEFGLVSNKLRNLYIMHTYSGLGVNELAKILDTTTDDIRIKLKKASDEINDKRPSTDRRNGTALIILSTELRNPSDSGFSAVDVPEYLIISLAQNLGIELIEPPTEEEKKKRVKIAAIISSVVILVVLGIIFIPKIFTAISSKSKDSTDSSVISEPVVSLDESLTYYADIEIENQGTITVKLDQSAAPVTVSNFVNLARNGFYDGLTFHRIIEDFMMQGGDPNGDGTGGNTDEDGNEVNIVGEFTDNGYENSLSHTRGAISMARSSENDSASSQFFIVHEDSTHLDGQYAVFGYVTEGLDIVDSICESAEPTDDNGTISSDAQPIITSITIRTE